MLFKKEIRVAGTALVEAPYFLIAAQIPQPQLAATKPGPPHTKFNLRERAKKSVFPFE